MATKFTCRFCKEQFDVPKGLYKHLQSAHNAGVSRDNRTCPICGVMCTKYEGYRDHLLYIHGQTDDGQKLTFKSLNEFLVWKAELELKHDCKYVLQTSPKVLPTKEKKYFYQCDRSDSKSKDKKSLSVVMKTCSSVISVVEGPGVFKVEYWDTHSGHSETPTVQSVQNELEAAISSVEIISAIAESDDSFDRSEELLIPGSSNSSISNAEKHSFVIKTNSSIINNFNSPSSADARKTKIIQSSGKVDITKKKSTNTSVLFSLASVACGKGISKKSANKANENKNTDAQSTSGTEVSSKIISEKSNGSSLSTHEEQKDESVSYTPVSSATPLTFVSTSVSSSSTTAVTTSTTATTTTSSLSTTVKPTTSGPPAIAPKISTVSSNSLNSLFTANSAFSNQFVIVNPVGMDQNSLNSNQNIFAAGQNLLFSIGTLGQNVLPLNTSQSLNPVSVAGEKTTTSNSSTKIETSTKVTASNVLTTSVKNPFPILQNALNNSVAKTSTVTSTTASTPIPLTAGNAPVILSSLPVGSTFMSVNNSLIPIATPSGTFLPTSLPPNIVLTPVMPSNVMPSTTGTTDSSVKSTISSTNVTSAPSNTQTQVRHTVPSTIAITVSSIVKEPVYTTSAIKHMSNIVTSSTVPVSSTASSKTSKKNQSRSAINAVSDKISPFKNLNKFMSSTPIKANLNLNLGKSLSTIIADNDEVNPVTSPVTLTDLTSKFGNKTYAGRVSSTISNKLASGATVTVSSVTTPKAASARKRITKGLGNSKFGNSVLNTTAQKNVLATSAVNTKVVNSKLAPISSAPNVGIPSQPVTVHKPGALLFESSGDVYMLEPVENDTAEQSSPLKRVHSSETPKIKIDRSVQTNESSDIGGLKSKLQRKRAAPPTDDSAVMLKVKCYQLEMKYLNCQTECKQLKVALTKERLKNAEITGEKVPVNEEKEEISTDTRNKAAEIMKEIEDRYSENKEVHIYTMTKTSVLRSLYEDLEELCNENRELYKELENYRAHDKFYKNLKRKLYDEEFEV